MKNQLFQWNFVIKGLIPDQVKLKRKVWLKKGELLLEKKGDELRAYLLGDDTHKSNNEDKIAAYLKISCLISNNAPDLEGGSGVSLKSKEELGKKQILFTSIRSVLPEEAIAGIESYAHKFIGFIGKLHDKYTDVVLENDNAMLNKDMRDSLKKEIIKGLKDFKLTIPRTFEGEGKHGHYRVTAW